MLDESFWQRAPASAEPVGLWPGASADDHCEFADHGEHPPAAATGERLDRHRARWMRYRGVPGLTHLTLFPVRRPAHAGTCTVSTRLATSRSRSRRAARPRRRRIWLTPRAWSTKTEEKATL